MKKEIKDRWIAALRSGKYNQIKSSLKTSDGYCCLGVLCEVVKDDIGLKTKEIDDETFFGAMSNSSNLPAEVIGYARIKSKKIWENDAADPYVTVTVYDEDTHEDVEEEHTLSELNDDLDYSFNEIADIIEAQL